MGLKLSSGKVSGSTLDQLQRDLNRVLYAVLKKKGVFLSSQFCKHLQCEFPAVYFCGPVRGSE